MDLHEIVIVVVVPLWSGWAGGLLLVVILFDGLATSILLVQGTIVGTTILASAILPGSISLVLAGWALTLC